MGIKQIEQDAGHKLRSLLLPSLTCLGTHTAGIPCSTRAKYLGTHPSPSAHTRPPHISADQQIGNKAKTTTLKFIHGYPVIEDKTAQPWANSKPVEPQLHQYNRIPGVQDVQQQRDQQRKQYVPVQHPDSHELQQAAAANPPWGLHTVRWTSAKTPGWLKYDRKVLRFFAYSSERVLYSPLEEVRIRRFELQYYLEDDSLEIVEPAEPNSGLPQGKYLQRHKVKLADGSPLKYDALRVGTDITIYSRLFHIVGCDAATRHFYQHDLSLPQAPDRPLPDGKFDAMRKAQEETEAERRRQPPVVKVSQQDLDDGFEPTTGPGAVFEYFEDTMAKEHLDRKLLRFYCCWDDTKRMFGQKLPFAIHYFLRDDTIEVAELHRRNTGRDPFPLLLSRRRLPRTPNVPPVCGKPLSPRSVRQLNIQYYHWSELRIGGIVKVYGRDLLIYDMDAFTRTWMQEHLRLPAADLAPIFVDFDLGPKRPPLQVPPNTLGIGTEEDSLQNVLHLIPKKPASNYVHYMENCDKVLRFSARLVPVPGQPLVGPHDADRRFVMSFYLLDNTLSIFETRRPNSGLPGGMFLDRMRVKKHSKDGHISAQDLSVGAVLTILSRHFQLLDADDFTLRFMESAPAQYPWASYDNVHSHVMSQLSQEPELGDALRTQLMLQDNEGYGYVTRQQLQVAANEAGLSLTAHEAITLIRHLGADGQGVVTEQLLQAFGLLPTDPALDNHPCSISDATHAGSNEQQYAEYSLQGNADSLQPSQRAQLRYQSDTGINSADLGMQGVRDAQYMAADPRQPTDKHTLQPMRHHAVAQPQPTAAHAVLPPMPPTGRVAEQHNTEFQFKNNSRPALQPQQQQGYSSNQGPASSVVAQQGSVYEPMTSNQYPAIYAPEQQKQRHRAYMPEADGPSQDQYMSDIRARPPTVMKEAPIHPTWMLQQLRESVPGLVQQSSFRSQNQNQQQPYGALNAGQHHKQQSNGMQAGGMKPAMGQSTAKGKENRGDLSTQFTSYANKGTMGQHSLQVGPAYSGGVSGVSMQAVVGTRGTYSDRQEQPSTLYQTTNRSLGGIHNLGSIRPM